MAEGATVFGLADGIRMTLLQCLQLFKRARLAPSELATVVLHLLVGLRRFEEFGVVLLESLPLTDLLVETEVAPRS